MTVLLRVTILLAVALAPACFACGDEAEYVYDEDWLKILIIIHSHSDKDTITYEESQAMQYGRTQMSFRADVKWGIYRDIKALYNAYDASLREKHKLDGKRICVELHIDASGKVVSAKTADFDNPDFPLVKDKKLKNTVVEMVKRWEYGETDKRGGVARGYISFTFGKWSKFPGAPYRNSIGWDRGGKTPPAAAVSGKTPVTPTPSITRFTDKRDGKSYRKVEIGRQTWMAENLNYAMKGSKCHDKDPSHCAKYGRLYVGSAAIKACPAGWHLPVKAEWEALENNLGDWKTAGKKLKSTSGWEENGNGTNEYGFSALPGGYSSALDIDYWKDNDMGEKGIWWSATEYEYGSEGAFTFILKYNEEDIDVGYGAKDALFSVRCVQDK
jgi:uncharacterized protein (TIGR02145 family)